MLMNGKNRQTCACFYQFLPSAYAKRLRRDWEPRPRRSFSEDGQREGDTTALLHQLLLSIFLFLVR